MSSLQLPSSPNLLSLVAQKLPHKKCAWICDYRRQQNRKWRLSHVSIFVTEGLLFSAYTVSVHPWVCVWMCECVWPGQAAYSLFRTDLPLQKQHKSLLCPTPLSSRSLWHYRSPVCHRIKLPFHLYKWRKWIWCCPPLILSLNSSLTSERLDAHGW